jgi:hypothetical protein
MSYKQKSDPTRKIMYINYQESPITEREDSIAMQSKGRIVARRVERRGVGWSQHASWWR